MPAWIRFATLAAVILALGACTTTRNVAFKATAPKVPVPLFQPLPVKVAVWYAPELATHRAFGTKTSSKPGGSQLVTHYDIDCGDIHLTVLRQMIVAAFSDVTELAAEPNWPLSDPSVRLVVVPRIERIAYGGGADVRYRIALLQPDGEHLTDVFVAGTAPDSLPEEKWLEVATRDAAAQILVRLTRSEKLTEWLDRHRQAGIPRAGLSS